MDTPQPDDITKQTRDASKATVLQHIADTL